MSEGERRRAWRGAAITDQVLGGHVDILKDNLGGGRRAHAALQRWGGGITRVTAWWYSGWRCAGGGR
eukprot:2199868-Prymnesium_polylepis.2